MLSESLCREVCQDRSKADNSLGRRLRAPCRCCELPCWEMQVNVDGALRNAAARRVLVQTLLLLAFNSSSIMSSFYRSVHRGSFFSLPLSLHLSNTGKRKSKQPPKKPHPRRLSWLQREPSSSERGPPCLILGRNRRRRAKAGCEVTGSSLSLAEAGEMSPPPRTIRLGGGR